MNGPIASERDSPVRQPSVAGSFYPSEPARLRSLVERLVDTARDDTGFDPTAVAGILVPHAGLVFSGAVAAAGWRRLGPPPDTARMPGPTTVVMLGTNHGAAWLSGVGAWERGSWRTPVGAFAVDEDLASAIVDLGAPFVVDRDAHRGEHSIEVQLPIATHVSEPGLLRIVPLAVSAGTGAPAVDAGGRLGRLLAERRALGDRIVIAISSDMAHYPGRRDCAAATEDLLPPLLDLDPVGLALRERRLVGRGVRGLVCGMCGIQPAVLGLAALRAFGAARGIALAAATSADAGGPLDRTVGYLSAVFVTT